MASEKRCHYEVLGLSRDCTPEDIRSAYKKLALQRHPDKLIQSGLSQAEATARFQELAHAYEVLSDPKERAWYDSHRSQILFADPNPSSANSGVPDLFSFFSNTVYSGYSDSGRGFYKVYSELFSKIYANEIDFSTKLGLGRDSVPEAPAMGNLESPYAQVTAFYNYWLGFITVMDFCWVDQYDAMAGPNRRSRRVMEEENKKLRKKARREYNETVRGLAEFVKKRDKRVIDMAMKRNLEMERRREIERERKRELERERLEKIKAYVEPEWAKAGEEEEEEEEERNEREEKAELYCVICGKKFKSEKQWKNHEQSKKHKEKVAEFRDSLGDEDSIEGEDDIEDEGGKAVEEENEEERVVDELGQGVRDGLEIKEEVDGNGFYVVQDSNGDFGNDGNENDDDDEEEEEEEEEEDEDEDEDDEMGVLKAMLAGHRSRKNVGQQREVKAAETGSEGLARDEDEIAGVGFMDYNNRKSSRRNRGNKERRKRNGDTPTDVTNKINDQSRETNANGSSNLEEPSSSHAFAEQSNDKGDDQLARDKKASKQPVDKKGTGKKDTNAKLKNSSKQKKSKATSKNSSNLCDTCGEEFESRNRLHKHLGETGHAALKSR